MELAQGPIVFGHLALTLEHMHFDRGLVIGRGREGFTLAGRNGGVACDQHRVHATEGLNTQGKRRHIEQEHVGDIASEYTALDGGTHRHHFVRIDATMGFFAEKVLHLALNQRHAGLTTNQNDLIDFARLEAGVLEGLAHWAKGPLDDVFDQLFELRPRETNVEVPRTGSIGRDERQVDLSLLSRGQADLGFFGRRLQALHGHRIARQIDTLIFFEFSQQPLDDLLIDVVAAQVGITIGRLHFNNTLTYLEDGDVEGATAKVVHRDLFVFLFVEAISERGRGRFVDQAFDFEAGDTTGVFGGLTLSVVEVGRNRDDRFSDFFAQMIFGRLLELLQDHGRNFRSRIFLVAFDLDADATLRVENLVRHHLELFIHFVEPATHEPFDRIDGVAGIGDRLPFGHLTHQAIATLSETHHRRCGAGAFRVGDDPRFVTFHNRNDAVRRT